MVEFQTAGRMANWPSGIKTIGKAIPRAATTTQMRREVVKATSLHQVLGTLPINGMESGARQPDSAGRGVSA